MIDLAMSAADQPFYANDELAKQIVARPDQNPPPAIESWPFLLQPKALHLRLAASPRCNSSCAGCEVLSVRAGNKEAEPEFPLEAWERVRDHWLAGDDGLTGIEVSGLGEPTLAKIFPQIARETLALGKSIYFPSNGLFLSTKRVTDALSDGTNVRVGVSMDACDEASYVACGRGKKGDWAKMIASVKKFQATCPNAQMFSQFTGFSYTISSLPGWMQVCADLGIKETIFRLGMAVGEIAREDTSLRFLKDKTESAIYAAQLIAEANGIAFEVERRPYSENQPNGLEPMSLPDDPTNRLRRYLDLAPMSVVVCGGNTTTISDGKTCTTIFGAQGAPVTNTYPQGTITTLEDRITTVTSQTTIICGTSTCVRTVSTLVQQVYSTGGNTTAATPVTMNSTSNSCPGFGNMSEGEAEVVRSVVVPRGTSLEAMSSPAFQPVSPVDSSPVVWADGSISSCFAKHIVGDIYKDTLPTLIRNPWYQAFLQRRITGAAGGVMAQESCANCPRNF